MPLGYVEVTDLAEQ